ncbi:GLPGLI family protein [Chryseobacterium defluvii]|uniref:GLPGLI family protein n=1 Tax=Chryseobacterium defluvii TaxID=160396 RepID=A0A840KAX6_9FLAO|nr:GLPGLI family protein [Chryseobacterium defluvii]MBB4805128.1 GLPGLI family protein [Chryseobacterium defluvii]
MKNILIVLFLLLMTLASSQTHRFIYELQLKMDSTESDYQKFSMILDIDPKEVKFYGRNLLIADSLNKRSGNTDNRHVDMTGQIVKRKINSFDHENFINIKFGYYTFNTHDEMKWKISDETKNVQGYILQKATTTFGGRNWTAWFSKDIPFNEGPFKFRGLPGLIFEIYDTKNNFIYNLSKSQKLSGSYPTHDFLESNFGTKAIPVIEKQKKKLFLEFYNDPFAVERNNFNKANTNIKINIGGKEIHTIDELNTQTRNMQGIIRKYNNPVELDKAIHYEKN